MSLEAVVPRKESMQANSGPMAGTAPPPVREVFKTKVPKPVVQEVPAEKKPPEEDHGEELLKDMLEVMKDHTSMRDVGFDYGFHEGTGRMTVTMIDKETDEVIREIPSERILDLMSKMEELVGVLFDAKA